MIRFIRSAEVVRGRQAEAATWGKQVAEFMNQAFQEATVHVFVSRFGQLGRVEWHIDFEDLAALDAYQQKVGADEKYQEQVKAGTELFVEGSLHDEVLLSV